MITALRTPGLVRNFAVQLPRVGVALDLDANSVDLSRNYPWDHGQAVGTNPLWRNGSRAGTLPLNDVQKLPAGTAPKLQRLRPDSVLFDGVSDTLVIPNSTGAGINDGFFLPWQSGTFDIILALRIAAYPAMGTLGGIVGNTQTLFFENGFRVDINESGQMAIGLSSTNGLITSAISGLSLPLNQIVQVRIFGDGSTVWMFWKYKPYSFPIDPFILFSSILSNGYGAAPAVGAGARDITIGSADGAGLAPNNNFSGELLYLMLADRPFAPVEIGLLDAYLDDKLVQR